MNPEIIKKAFDLVTSKDFLLSLCEDIEVVVDEVIASEHIDFQNLHDAVITPV